MGELIVDEDLNVLRLQDGSTAGGHIIPSAAVPRQYGGTGQTSYTDGQLLIGDSSTSGLDKATLTAGSGISITNGHGSITINAAPSSGSGGGFALDPVTTGTSKTVTLSSPQQITYWSSATAGSKTTSLPGAAAGNSGYLWIEKTTLGNGDLHTITPTSGTIEGGANFSYNDAKDAVAFISDGSSNWMLAP